MSEEQKAAEGQEENFAEMLEKSMPKRSRLQPGQMVEARIVKISGEWVFLDLGGKGEGYLDKKEVLDEFGQATVKEGEMLRAYFLSSKNNDMVFTTRIGSGPAVKNQLEDAWKSRVPVEGTVAREIKGGFEVKIGAVRAFCPFSQMALRRSDDKTACINQTYRFMISEYAENGRNIVVTRRPIVEEEERTRKAELRQTLKEGMRLTGRVVSIQNFGAFVQAGGIEGLLPISELSYTRVAKVTDVLSQGQEIEVVLKKMDWQNEKFSFSLKDILTDPWDSVEAKFPVGSFHSGTVNRLMPFGAFVSLGGGIDGLIHVSRLGGDKRISHPKEAVKEGQAIEVRVETVDRANRKIGLSLAEVSRAEAEAAATIKEFQQKQSASDSGMGTLGDLLKAQMEKKRS